MIRFRVQVQGHLVETWEVDAHDVQDAITRVRAAEGSWVGAEWSGEPRFRAQAAKVADLELAADQAADRPCAGGGR